MSEILRAQPENGVSVENAKKRFLSNLTMYEISGDVPLTNKDIDRYLKSNEEIEELLNRSERDSERVYPPAQTDTENATPKILDKNQIILALESQDETLQMAAVRAITEVPAGDRTDLVRRCLQNSNLALPIRLLGAETIIHAPLTDRTDLILTGLEDKDPLVRQAAAGAIFLAPRANLNDLIERCYHDQDPVVRQKSIHAVQKLTTGREHFIRRALSDTDSVVRIHAAAAILCAELQVRVQLVQEVLDRTMEDPEVRRQAVELISKVGEGDRARLIERYIADGDIAVRRIAVMAIPTAPSEDHESLIELVFQTSGAEPVYPALAAAVWQLPEEKRQRMFVRHPAFIQALQILATKTPLYDGNDKKFFTRTFEKTGSETILLDVVPGHPEISLKNRVIMRTIDPKAYSAWKRAYEDSDFWKSWGFDYVPIEPIVKVALSKGNKQKVDVFTKVINGPSVAIWETNTGLYNKKIHVLVEKLRDALEALGVEHGHTHEGNFIVHFDRGENGEVVLDRAPKVYIIDFDQAVSYT